MENTLALIKRSSACYRPYAFKGNYVDSIVFFNETGIIYQTNSGWLENEHMSNATHYVGGTDVEYVEVVEPKLKRKVDFTVKHNFYTTKKETYGNETRATIYILCNDAKSKVKVTKVKEELITKTSMSINEYDELFTEFVITGVNEKEVTVISKEVKRQELNELGKKAQEMIEKHKNSDYNIRQLDIYTWARILKQYDLIEKPAPAKI